MIIGGYATYIDAYNIVYIWGVALILLAILATGVNFRNKNYLGMFIGGYGSAEHHLNTNEKSVGTVVLSLLVSPIVFVLIMSAYSYVSL